MLGSLAFGVVRGGVFVEDWRVRKASEQARDSVMLMVGGVMKLSTTRYLMGVTGQWM